MAAFCCITCIAQEKEALETDVVLNSGLSKKGSPRQRSFADPCSLEHVAASKDEAGRGSGGYVSSNCFTTTREALKIKVFY